MNIATIEIEGTSAKIRDRLASITAGMVGATVTFVYSEEWAGFSKTAVFRYQSLERSVAGISDVVEIPPEMLSESGEKLQVGLYGVSPGGQAATPTIWVSLGRVQPGAAVGNDSGSNPALQVWAQILSMIGQLGELETTAKSSLVAAINELVRRSSSGLPSFGKEDGRNVELDTTLTQGGKAADAKATGDEIKRVAGLIPSIEGLAKEEDIPVVPTWAMQSNKPSYTASEVGADPTGTAAVAVSAHNANNEAHSDIRLEIKAIREQLAAFMDVDDETLNELSELIAAIASNQTSIAQLTTGKVSVVDIVNNLVTNASNKPLSAAMGAALAGEIDSVRSPLAGYQPKGNYLTEHQDLGHLLPRMELSAAIDTALAQAKESGEFDAPPGAPGAPGDDYVLTDADRQEIAEIAADIVQASDREELPITDMAGYKIAPTGTVLTGDAATQLVSAPIPINGGDTLLVTGSAKFGNSLWAIYDAAGGMLRNEAAPATAEGAAVEAVEVEVPVGAATIRVAWDKGVSTIPYAVARSDGQGQSGAALPLAGVTVAIIGDSIVEHNATADTNWVDIVAAATGASITNLGVGGTGWMQGQEDGTAYYQRVADIPADTRRVLIYGSGNDRELPLGTPADTGTDTLCGCINATLDAVYAHVPTAWVGVISPAPWQHYPPYERGNAMDLMAQAQAAICRRRGVPFLDLYHSSGLRPWDAAFRELAYHDADGVHPNNTGHGLIAPQMLAFLLGGTHNPVDAQEIAKIAAGLVEVPNVKPVAKTEDMTQPVGVDEEGRLWSAPTAGGSGGGFAEWELLTDITLSEESAIAPIKYDDKYREMYATLTIPKVDEKISTGNQFRLLHNNGLYYINIGDANYSYIYQLRCEIFGGTLYEMFCGRAQYGVANQSQVYTRSSLAHLKGPFVCGGPLVLPAETRLIVYGRE